MSRLALVFPGQGSQSIGMLQALAAEYTLVEDTFKEVSDHLGFDVWALTQQGPEEKLNQTEYTQVVMLTADVAVFRLLNQLAPLPINAMAGHSLGEYAALVCANALTLTDAAYLVSKRGQLMQQTVPAGEGAMAAIVGLTDEQVEAICRETSSPDNLVTPANFNAIGQVVIAGHTAAVQKAIQHADAAGARMAVIIPVSVPCHCPLLADAADLFAEYLANTPFKTPGLPVISNVDISCYDSPVHIRSLLKEQLVKPVRWVEIIQSLPARGVGQIIEAGPGKVLSGLIKRIDKSLTATSVNDPASLRHAIASFIGVTNE